MISVMLKKVDITLPAGLLARTTFEAGRNSRKRAVSGLDDLAVNPQPRIGYASTIEHIIPPCL
jgi:hypothetical protein